MLKRHTPDYTRLFQSPRIAVRGNAAGEKSEFCKNYPCNQQNVRLIFHQTWSSPPAFSPSPISHQIPRQKVMSHAGTLRGHTGDIRGHFRGIWDMNNAPGNLPTPVFGFENGQFADPAAKKTPPPGGVVGHLGTSPLPPQIEPGRPRPVLPLPANRSPTKDFLTLIPHRFNIHFAMSHLGQGFVHWPCRRGVILRPTRSVPRKKPCANEVLGLIVGHPKKERLQRLAS
jgi:hypothetical protein